MMRTVITAALLGLLAVVTPAAQAQQRAVTLPETPVTLVARGAALFDVLDALGQQADVTLEASPHLLDKRATVYAHDRPLREVLEGIAEVWSHPQFPAHWRAKPRERGVLELHQSPEVDRELDRMAAHDQAALLDRLHRFALVIQETGRIPTEVQDPIATRLLERLGGRAPLLHLLALVPPQGRAAFLTSDGLTLPFDAIPPSLQPEVAGAITGVPGAGALRQLQGASINIRLFARENSWALGTRAMRPTGSGGTLSGGGLQIGFSLPDPVRRRQSRSAAAPLPEGLRGELQQVGGDTEFADLQLHLARALGVTVVSDYHRNLGRHLHRSRDGITTVEDYLDGLVEAVRYDWWKRDDTLVFRNLYWFQADAREVPARVERRLLLAVRERGWLTLDDLAEVAWLTEGARERLGDLLRIQGLDAHRGFSPFLGWYGALGEADRRRVAEGEAVPLARAGEVGVRHLFPGGTPVNIRLYGADPRTVQIGVRQQPHADGRIQLEAFTVGPEGPRPLGELLQPAGQTGGRILTGILVPEDFEPSGVPANDAAATEPAPGQRCYGPAVVGTP
jgi:hypothetical protein